LFQFFGILYPIGYINDILAAGALDRKMSFFGFYDLFYFHEIDGQGRGIHLLAGDLVVGYGHPIARQELLLLFHAAIAADTKHDGEDGQYVQPCIIGVVLGAQDIGHQEYHYHDDHKWDRDEQHSSSELFEACFTYSEFLHSRKGPQGFSAADRQNRKSFSEMKAILSL
jgi:hypothetical protein